MRLNSSLILSRVSGTDMALKGGWVAGGAEGGGGPPPPDDGC